MSVGEEATVEFIQQRLVEKSVKFHQPMHKLKLKTFEAMAVRKQLASSKQKTVKVKAERNLLGQLLMLCQTHDVCLDKLFTYPLAPIPWSLATADGSMCKTRMWANAQPDGRPVEHRWRPLFNAAKFG